MRAALSALAIVFVAAACGPLPGGGTPATAASVAVQSSDLPSGMKKCEVSGDIDAYVAKVKAKDPTHYATIKKEWDDAKSHGATAGEVAVFADTAEHCSAFQSNSSDITTATFKLVVNFVIEFKDEAAAAKGYTSESILGFSPSTIKSSGSVPVTEGTKSGLGANSIVLTLELGGQSFYVAVWQNKKFMSILAVLNLDQATSKKIASAVNGRIK